MDDDIFQVLQCEICEDCRRKYSRSEKQSSRYIHQEFGIHESDGEVAKHLIKSKEQNYCNVLYRQWLSICETFTIS